MRNENDTWDIISLPFGKWRFKTIYNQDGTVDRHNERLVILGCRQKYGVDYMETFAPIAKMATVRALFAVVATKDCHYQMEVKNDFLRGELEGTVVHVHEHEAA